MAPNKGIRPVNYSSAKPYQKYKIEGSTVSKPLYVNPVFNHFLDKRIKNRSSDAAYSIDAQGNLVDSTTGITWKANGTMTNKKGQVGTWNTKNYSYSWQKPQITQPQKKNTQPANQSNGTKPTSNSNTNVQPRINNSAEGRRIMAWQRRLGVKADGWWGKNTTAAYNTWLAKQNPNKPGQTLQQTTQSINPKLIQGTPSIHVGNNGVTYTDSKGTTTDVTNSHNLRETIWGTNPTVNTPTVNTQFLEQTVSNLISPNQQHFGRSATKDFMRQQGLVNPENYSRQERNAFRHSINNDEGDWSAASRIMSDARINNKLGQATGLNNYQLQKPQLNTPNQLNNNLVNLKFRQGGQMYKYQQGGQAGGQQEIEQQAIALVQAAMQGDQQANQTIQQIMQAAQQGDQQALQVAQLLQAIIQKMQGSRKARLGAKLNYFKQTNECPEGQEVVYFKKGGEICKVCQGRKMQNGGKSNPVSDFKKKREQEQLKKNYQKNPATKGKSAKEIAEMQKRNRQEASQGKGESPANVAPWQYKKK